MWTCIFCGEINDEVDMTEDGMICEHCGKLTPIMPSLSYEEFKAYITELTEDMHFWYWMFGEDDE